MLHKYPGLSPLQSSVIKGGEVFEKCLAKMQLKMPAGGKEQYVTHRGSKIKRQCKFHTTHSKRDSSFCLLAIPFC